ncbi:hypothetical protein AVEN_135446-1 [Araneus ventricosus]|uniref:Uncharacterized protein n=1 Tax=Araneus ventricosus TaxID=182803 RepID=A0A4Y2BFC2_ARAVE|nr:hypothetical protein AVEN_135446-1 [Araneus ventricosus]
MVFLVISELWCPGARVSTLRLENRRFETLFHQRPSVYQTTIDGREISNSVSYLNAYFEANSASSSGRKPVCSPMKKQRFKQYQQQKWDLVNHNPGKQALSQQAAPTLGTHPEQNSIQEKKKRSKGFGTCFTASAQSLLLWKDSFAVGWSGDFGVLSPRHTGWSLSPLMGEGTVSFRTEKCPLNTYAEARRFCRDYLFVQAH